MLALFLLLRFLMIAWMLTFFFFFLGIRALLHEFLAFEFFLGRTAQKRVLSRVIASFQEIEETLMAGLVPTSDRWGLLEKLEEPWRSLSVKSVQELRSAGASLVPTLQRLRNLANVHDFALESAHAKASQAVLQALLCSGLVPLVGTLFYWSVPGIGENLMIWLVACVFSFLCCLCGSYWMLLMASQARWGGLKKSSRCWMLASQCAAERLFAWIRMGSPADLAWIQSVTFLKIHASELSSLWGSSVWSSVLSSKSIGLEKLILDLGVSIKKSIQVSLLEGRPCLKRLEDLMEAFRGELQSHIERELMLLPTRVLKPLFVFVAPSLMALLGLGFWLAIIEVWDGN
jgi:hypothetical protein